MQPTRSDRITEDGEKQAAAPVSNMNDLFTKLDFDDTATDDPQDKDTLVSSPRSSISDGLSSPATPLLQSWNYLDDIPEDASKAQEIISRNHHQRYHSYDSPIYTIAVEGTEHKELMQDVRLSVPYLFELFGPFSVSSYGEYLGIDVTHDRRDMSIEAEASAHAKSIPTRSPGKKTQRRHSIASLSASTSFPSDDQGTHPTIASLSKFDRSFCCTTCPSRFARSHDLKRHEKTHSGERPFNCTRCLRNFTRSDALVRHNRLGNCLPPNPEA